MKTCKNCALAVYDEVWGEYKCRQLSACVADLSVAEKCKWFKEGNPVISKRVKREKYYESCDHNVVVSGQDGRDGKSAYELAVENGFVGTEVEWLASLRGADGKIGKDGSPGADGHTPVAGVDYWTDADKTNIVNEIVTMLPTGIQGPKGDKGDVGPQGLQGEAGPAGPAGKDGAKGDTGAQGPKGDKGDTGAQGPKGDKGDTGAPGPKGDKGDVGPQGPTGMNGEDGAQGPKGDKGDVGPQGPKGDTGPQGPVGMNGEDGYTPVRGTDYWTTADINVIKSYVDDAILNGSW